MARTCPMCKAEVPQRAFMCPSCRAPLGSRSSDEGPVNAEDGPIDSTGEEILEPVRVAPEPRPGVEPAAGGPKAPASAGEKGLIALSIVVVIVSVLTVGYSIFKPQGLNVGGPGPAQVPMANAGAGVVLVSQPGAASMGVSSPSTGSSGSAPVAADAAREDDGRYLDSVGEMLVAMAPYLPASLGTAPEKTGDFLFGPSAIGVISPAQRASMDPAVLQGQQSEAIEEWIGLGHEALAAAGAGGVLASECRDVGARLKNEGLVLLSLAITDAATRDQFVGIKEAGGRLEALRGKQSDAQVDAVVQRCLPPTMSKRVMEVRARYRQK